VIPPPPERKPIPVDWPHRELYNRVIATLRALPGFFKSSVNMAGIQAPDLHTMALPLGAAIEDQVVATLNEMRTVWDPEKKYSRYSFVRQPQTFPDVLMTTNLRDPVQNDIILGMEMKGWYLLSKEKEGSFRYLASPTATNPWDLIVVVPWVFEHVTTGAPRIFEPYVESALYAAEYRNWHWQYSMEGHEGEGGELILARASPYPNKKDRISDRAVHDGGNNFGRLFRTGLMNDFVEKMNDTPILGIPARYWQMFFKVIEEAKMERHVDLAIQRLKDGLKKGSPLVTDDEIDGLLMKLQRVYFDMIAPPTGSAARTTRKGTGQVEPTKPGSR
jgi:hypothetical protein